MDYLELPESAHSRRVSPSGALDVTAATIDMCTYPFSGNTEELHGVDSTFNMILTGNDFPELYFAPPTPKNDYNGVDNEALGLDFNEENFAPHERGDVTLSALSQNEEQPDATSNYLQPTKPPAFPALTPHQRAAKEPRSAFGSPVSLMLGTHSASPAKPPLSVALDAETKRQKHNDMMRENRGRENSKFNELKAVLNECAPHALSDLSMPNKIQILDCATTQYSAMLARRAALRTAVLLGPERDATAHALLATARTLQDAVETLARILLGAQGWSAAELWMRGKDNHFEMVRGLVSAKNAAHITNSVQKFATKGKKGMGDILVQCAARLHNSVWIPNLRACSRTWRADCAKVAGVSTAIYVPIRIGNDDVCEVVLVLYDASEDEDMFRQFDADDVARIDELASAVLWNTRVSN